MKLESFRNGNENGKEKDHRKMLTLVAWHNIPVMTVLYSKVHVLNGIRVGVAKTPSGKEFTKFTRLHA